MPAFFRRHVGVRLAAIWLVVAIPLSAVLLLTYSAWYSARLTLIEQARRGYAQTVATSFQLMVLDMRFSLRSSGGPIADTGPTFVAGRPELQRLARRYPFAYVAFADTRGRVLASSRTDLVGTNLGRDPAFVEAVRTNGGGIEPSHDSSGGVVGFHVAQSVPARPGRRGGVMVGLVDVRRLYRAFPVTVPAGGISLIDSSGQVVFQNENIALAERKARWGRTFPFVRRALEGSVAVTRSFHFPGDGTRIAVFVPIRPQGWAAGSSVAPTAALAPFYRTLEAGLPVALIVGAVALLASVLISRGIRDSLARLSEDAARIGSGRLEEPVRVDREDEIGDVARSLETARVELLDALSRAQHLYQEQAERARLSEALTAIDHNIHETMSPDEILRRVLPEAAAALGVDSAAAGFQEPGGWRVRYEYGLQPGLVGRLFSRDELRTAELATRSREVVSVDDAMADPRVNPATVREFGARSFILGPLVALNEVIGVVLLVHRGGVHEFSLGEVDFVRRLSVSLGLALANAQTYESEHRIAETLQTALLALPERIPGVEFADLYHSATEAARVGGDFYDLFELEHARVGITIGDISGHGIDSAVLTSLVKNAIRVQATQEDKAPDEVMSSASRVLFDNSPGEVFATVFFGILCLEDGLLEYCSGGHTTGARICSNGGLRRLPANSPLIGAFGDEAFELSRERLELHDLLFLYTDGLTEARRGRELFGEERLFELLERDAGGDPERTVRGVVEAVLAFAGGRLSDDLAILAVRRTKTHSL